MEQGTPRTQPSPTQRNPTQPTTLPLPLTQPNPTQPTSTRHQRNIAGARDPEVLALFAQAIEKLGESVAQYVPRIMEAVFECTLLMITRNFEVLDV